MQYYIFLGLMRAHVVVGALSSWMRYTGYYLSGHTRKEEVAVPTVEDCWEACLRETGFKCLSVAYAAVGSRSCRLYDKRALSVYNDWTRSTEFSYYEYCANGTWTWTNYGGVGIIGHNMDEYRMENVNANDIKRCLDHCQTVPGCGAVDYASGPKFCHMNDAIGLDAGISVYEEFDLYTRCKQVTYDYMFRRLSSGMDSKHMWFSYGILDIIGNTEMVTVEVRYRNICPVLCLTESRCLGYRLGNSTVMGGTVCQYILAD